MGVALAAAEIYTTIESGLKDRGFGKYGPGQTFKFTGSLSLLQKCHVSTVAPTPEAMEAVVMGCLLSGITVGKGAAKGRKVIKMAQKGAKLGKNGSKAAKYINAADKLAAKTAVKNAKKAGKNFGKEVVNDIIESCNQTADFTAWTAPGGNGNHVYTLYNKARNVWDAAKLIAEVNEAYQAGLNSRTPDTGSTTSSTVALADVNSSVRSDAPQLWRSIPGAFSTGTLVGQWKDQGWGNRKGHIYARKDGGNWVRLTSTAAPHAFQQFSIRLPTSVLGGSKIDLAYSVGGGGGHRLYIRSAKAALGPNAKL